VHNLFLVSYCLRLGSFLTPVIKQEWNLDSSTVSMLASIFYLGIFSGSIISGKLSDKHGRKSLIMIGTFLQIVFSVLFLVANTVAFMTFMRFGYGFSFGFTIALTTSMYAESSPMRYRGKGLLFLNFCVSLGKIFGIALAYFFLSSYTEGDWRLMMFVSGFPSVLVLIGTYKYM
jgi:MFS family permease